RNLDASTTVVQSILFIDFASTLFILSLILIVMTYIIWNYMKKKIPLSKQLHVYNRIPVFRAFLRMRTTYFFTTQMSMFLKTGMPIKNILYKMANQDKLPIIAHYAELMTA